MATIQNTPGSTADRIDADGSFALDVDGGNDEGLEVATDATLQSAPTIGQRYGDGTGTNTWEIDVVDSPPLGWRLRFGFGGYVRATALADVFDPGWNHVVLVMEELPPDEIRANLYINGVLRDDNTFLPLDTTPASGTV